MVLLKATTLVLWSSLFLVHNTTRPELNGWYENIQSVSGFPCCDGKDAIPAEDWDTKDGHYIVMIYGQWINVPDSAIVKTPNLDGRALVWYRANSVPPLIRCFLPGSMT